MKRGRPRRLIRPALVAALAFLATSCASHAPQDYLKPSGSEAIKANNLFQPVFWIAAAIFFLVEGLVIFAVVKFRDRPGREEPKQIHGNSRLEFTWTLIPALILAGVAIPTVLTIFNVAAKPAPNQVRIHVTGHQWWWEYEYLDTTPHVFTANELVIPVDRSIYFTLDSADVIHSFWVPKLSGKQDVVPGRTNTLEFTAFQTGEFYGQCAEYCSLSHANMRLRVIVKTQADYDTWLREQQAGPAAPASPDATQGQQVFMSNVCITCHTIEGTPAQGKLGPNLTHFASRGTFAGSMFDNTPDNVSRWIHETSLVKPGVIMPRFGCGVQGATQPCLNDDQIRQIVAYLESLK
ncbi:MAG: cytochrome c oxidase subunit II [Actinomycetota bacterium]